jgi:hypothetical protein
VQNQGHRYAAMNTRLRRLDGAAQPTALSADLLAEPANTSDGAQEELEPLDG